MEGSSGVQSEVTSIGQDENMNHPDKIEMETSIHHDQKTRES